KATQPWSYRLQKWLLSNTFLTKNMKVLVYGEWPNQTKNIVPFFTASYSVKEINDQNCLAEPNPERWLLSVVAEGRRSRAEVSRSEAEVPFVSSQIENTDQSPLSVAVVKFLFVGALTKGKQPLLSVAVVQKLKQNGHQVQLNIYGEGPERLALEQYITANDLENTVILHGNCNKETIKKAYQTAHFLLFISQSEGWPKAVAEAMFWGCLPITSKVSCIPYMLANGERGALVNANADEIVTVVENYLQHPDKYNLQAMKAMDWSRQFTMEKFEEEIGKIMGP
ncbi:MAG: glycosyltransferase, partial [Lutibacter sp.]|nr:glycosyltransferase [Lutibacter sp.]